MSKAYLIFLFIIIFTTACGQTEKKPNEHLQKEKPDIRILISKLKPIVLPFTLEIPGNIDYSKLYEPDKIADSAFFLPYEQIIGYLPDTTNLFRIVYLYPGDEIFPNLKTFTKKGKYFSDENLYIENSRCGPACGIDSCRAITTINKNLDVRFVEKLYSRECDSLDNEISKTNFILSIIQNGKILDNGKISLEKELIIKEQLGDDKK